MNYFYKFCCLIFIILQSCQTLETTTTLPEVLSFSFGDVRVLSVQIDNQQKKIVVEVPYQTSLVRITPQIKVTDKASIVPLSGVPQDFTQKVYYTLSSKEGMKVIYSVEVKTSSQPNPEILSLEKDSVEAGFDFIIRGNNFGKFSLDVKAFLQDIQQKETQLLHQLIDSTTIKLKIPIDLGVGNYLIKLQIKSKSVFSEKRVFISYPAPQLKGLEKGNFLNTDTLWVLGKYIDASRYQFSAELQSNSSTKIINQVSQKADYLGFLLNPTVLPQAYEVKLYNQSERKYSREKGYQIQVYSFNKPFIKEIQSPKATYQKGETITLNTLNFTEASARFYQVSLQNGGKNYTQNGIYDSAKKTLTFSLPANIEKGTYKLSVTLTEPDRAYNYSFDTDLIIAVKE